MPKTLWPSAATFMQAVVLCFALALFFEQAGARHILGLEGASGAGMMTTLYWLSLLSPAFFLWALWAAAQCLGRIDRGESFGPSMVRGLKETGYALMLGAWVAILVQPALIHLFANGFTEMRGVRLDWSIANLTIAMVGFVLAALARAGGRIKAELDEFV
jgi:hypothetical protein